MFYTPALLSLRNFSIFLREKVLISYTRFRDVQEHIELSQPLEVNLNVIIVEHNNFYYYINFHDCPKQGQTATDEFGYFKKSLRMI